MSLDVYLTVDQEPTSKERAVALLKEHGFEHWADFLDNQYDEENHREKFSANITHNLSPMADAAGIGKHLWNPESLGITKASQLIEPLRKGLELLRSDPDRFIKLDSPNGWGTYWHFVPFVREYLNACEEYPDAKVSVWR